MFPLEKVREIIASSLYLDDVEAVLPSSRLIGDLGAESIDFLDIMFQLEEAFGVRIPKGEIERQAKEGLTDDEFAINGVLQTKGLERMRQIMTEIDPAAFKPGLKLHDIPSLYTVATLVALVESRLAAKGTPSAVPTIGAGGTALPVALKAPAVAVNG